MDLKKLLFLIAIFSLLIAVVFGCGSSAYLTGAKVAIQDDDWERAEELVEKALTDTPNDWEVHLWMGLIHNHFERYDEATAAFKRANELAPDENAKQEIGRRRFENAVKLMQNERFEVAEKEISEINFSWDTNSSEMYNIARLYMILGGRELDEAKREEYFQKSVEYFQQSVDIAMSEVEEAEKKDSGQLPEIKKQAAACYSGLGSAYSQKGNYDKASEAFKQAMELNPEEEKFEEQFLTSRFKKGAELIQAEKFDEAVDYYQGILEEKPDATDAYFYMGKIYMEKADKLAEAGDTDGATAEREEAAKYFEMGIEANPEDAETLDELYKLYSDMDKLDDALRIAENMAALYPEKTTAVVLLRLGQIHQQRGSFEEALVAFQRYIDDNPDDAMGYAFKGAVLVKMSERAEEAGDADKAAEYHEQALKVFEKSNELQGN